MKQKLIEYAPFENYKIVESDKAKKGVLLTVEGLFQRADTQNHNKRLYPKDKVWDRLFKNEEFLDRVKKKQMVGMFGHPKDGQTVEEKISHIVTKQKMNTDGIIEGKAEILDTPCGRIVSTLFEAGVTLGISSRGDGSVIHKEGYDEVQEDFNLETYDFVLNPSTPGAFPTIVSESVNNESNTLKTIVALSSMIDQLEGTNDYRKKVLNNVKEIVESINSENNSVKTLIQKIESKLVENNNEPNKEVTMNGVNNPMFATTGIPATGQSDVLNGSVAYIQNQVNAAEESLKAQFDKKEAELKDLLIQNQKESKEISAKLEAAEDVIEDMIVKMRVMKEEKKKIEENQTDESGLKAKYEAGVALLDEALDRLKELGPAKIRVEQLEKLVESFIEKERVELVYAAIDSCLDQVAESKQKEVALLLKDCRTPKLVEEKWNQLKKLIVAESAPVQSNTIRHQPLPTAHIQEEKKTIVEAKQPVAATVANHREILRKRLAEATGFANR